MKKTIEDKIAYAKEQSFTNFENSIEVTSSSFEFDGCEIVCPWMDETGRFELSDAEAVEKYGLANIIKFIEKISE